MTASLDSIHDPLGCPECSHPFKLPIGRLDEDCSIRCPECGASLKINNY